MTGKYPGRLHITGAGGHLKDPQNPGVPETGPPHVQVLGPQGKGTLPLEEYTLAEALREAGYRTCFVGKWHLGHDEKYWPEHQGFDINIGGGRWPGPPSHFSPYRISNLPDGPTGEYITDRLTDEAIRFIESAKTVPFFLNLWHYAVHAPYQGKEEHIECFEKKKDPRSAQDNAVMAAMIRSMDESLGRVLDQLEEKGLMDHTIIIFTSDNGGNMYDRTTRDGTNLGAWASEGRTPTNNAPLRSGKGSVYEGGVRVPALIYWPGVSRTESISEEIITSVDYYPTLLDMLGITPSDSVVFDGISIVPALKGGKLDREAIYGHFPHNLPAVPIQMASWVRKKDWKLIRFYQQDEYFPNELELYHLATDIGEIKNRAEDLPEVTRELESMLDQHLERTGAAVPKRNPLYDPNALREVQGWRPMGTCGIFMEDETLRIQSTGGDPYIVNGDVPKEQGPLRIVIKMRSQSSGTGQFFWTTDQERGFGPNQRLDFHPIHHGNWEDIEVSFQPKSPLLEIRIDPSVAPGIVDIQRIQIFSGDGQVLRTWDFTK